MTGGPDRLHLEEILECAVLVSQYARAGRDDFLADAAAQQAVWVRLRRLAEAARRLSADLRRRHPEAAWESVQNLEPDAAATWQFIERHLGALRAAAEIELRPPA